MLGLIFVWRGPLKDHFLVLFRLMVYKDAWVADCSKGMTTRFHGS